MIRYTLFLIFLMAVTNNLVGQDLKTGQPLSKEKISNIAEYERLIKYYRYYKQDSAVYFTARAIGFARQQKDSNGIALILLQMGMIDDNKGEFDSSQIKYKQALDIFKSIGSKTGTASATIRIGVVELRNGKFDNAMKHFLEALKISEQARDQFGIMEANYSISWAYLDQHSYEMALHYLKTAEQINDSLPFSSLSLNIFNHLGVVYRDKGDLQKAKQYLEKGVRLSTAVENQGLNITLINNLASVYSRQGHKEKAIQLQKEALHRSKTLGNYLRELQVLLGLAKTYGDENPVESIYYLKEAILLARSKGAYHQEIRYLKIITPLYVKQGNYEQAFMMKEREHALADSFYYKSMSKNIESLKAEYELSKSNARIKELNLLNNKRRLELENSTIIRNVTFAGTGLLIIILVLLYNQYRIKQRNNREISLKNHSLQHLLDEKEWLLKEVHHRVKNNLHTIMSLLETQSAYLKDDALLALQNSQHRVYAMSLIHQKLYQGEYTTNVNMAVYLPELINYLRDSFDVRPRIRFYTNIENIHLDISQAIPIGLIVNEAITNSIKYAFPNNQNGDIHIKMTNTDEKMILLSVKDNGVGLPADWDQIQKNSLGLKLMKGLSEDIRAKFLIENIKGTIITVKFRGGLFIKETQGKERIKIMQLQS